MGDREAHYVFKSPLDRKRRILTIAKRFTDRPEDLIELEKEPTKATTRRAALQILLGKNEPKSSRHQNIQPLSKA